MNTFKFKTRYVDCDDCYFRISAYENGNLAVEVWNNEEGPMMRITVNPDYPIPREFIAVKDYSENEGVVEWLLSMDIIEEVPIQVIKHNYVTIPVYRLTKNGVYLLSR